MKTYLITGTNGFIGYSLAKSLLEDGHKVIGIDLDVDANIEVYRNKILNKYENFVEVVADIAWDSIEDINEIKENSDKIDYCIHLAAKTGVRESATVPFQYLKNNIEGFYQILELVKENKWPLIYASSSSVYGNADNTDCPESFYAATKKCNEIMAESYCNAHGINAIGCRFFTVYGPAGRPDMSVWKFVKAMISDEYLEIYGNAEYNSRDFTYIADVVRALKTIIYTSSTKQDRPKPHKIYDIGRGYNTYIRDLIGIIEIILQKNAKIKIGADVIGDVDKTIANTIALEEDYNVIPKTGLHNGLIEFIKWYKEYENINRDR